MCGLIESDVMGKIVAAVMRGHSRRVVVCKRFLMVFHPSIGLCI